jgi:hypothetical protein
MQMRFLPDTPIETHNDDVLGFTPFAEQVGTALKTTQPPFVYGILGDWGTGKTSTLHLLQEQLHNEPTLIPIFFNPWKYENEASLIYPLLHTIKQHYENQPEIKAMQEDRGTAFLGKFKEVIGASTFVVGDIGLRAATKYLTDQAVGVKDIDEALKRMRAGSVDVLSDWTNSVDQLETIFAQLLEEYAKDLALARPNLKSADIHFVILIDDLDRCLPSTTIAILESIKNYLAVKAPALFVLALNAKVVYQGIQAKYKGLEIDGREYLEKILNYSFYLPEPVLDRVKGFATSRLNDLLVNPEERAEWEHCLHQFGVVLEACKFNNPRKIKRILNRYLLLISQHPAEIENKAFNLDNLVRLIVLGEYYHRLFNWLYGSTTPDTLIRDIGQKNTYKELVADHDLAIPDSYPPLFRLKPLFDLKSMHSLRQELDAVFTLTRML